MLMIYEHSEGVFDFRLNNETKTAFKTGFYIPGAQSYQAKQSTGHFYYQIFRHPAYTIYRSTYQPFKDLVLRVSRPDPFVGFRIMLQKHILHELNDTSYYLLQGQANFVCAPSISSALHLQKDQVYEVFDMELTPSMLMSLQLKNKKVAAFLETFQNGFTLSLGGGPAFVGAKVLDMVNELLLQPSNQTLAEQLLQLIIRAITGKRSNRSVAELHIENLFHVRNSIQKHLALKQHVHDWSKMANMNVTYFKELFKMVFHETPYHYLIQERIKAAKKIMQHQPHLSLAEVAIACGFNDYNNLRRAFYTSEKISLAHWQKIPDMVAIYFLLDNAF